MTSRVMRILGLTFFFALLAFFYLQPATRYLFQGRSDVMLGDGSDMAALPFEYAMLVQTAKTHWTQLFYGAVHTFQFNPPHGFLVWFTWIEKMLVPVLSPFFTLEQMATVIGWILLVANGLAFYGFGRTLKWPRIISLGLGIAWAFNAFTRARASVHLAMAGTFFLPLTLIGVFLLFRKSTPKQKFIAALCFVTAVMCQQYFIVCLVLLAPFFVVYGLLAGEKKKLSAFRLSDFLVVMAPIAFLVWNLAMPAPAKFMTQGTVTEPPPVATELFMNIFAAKPIDYLGFDLKQGTDDWNPLRRKINEAIEADIGQSNEHEHSHGIRWSLLLIAGWAIAETFRRRSKISLNLKEKRLIWLFLGMAILSFWTSLAPNSLELFGVRWSPFLLINALFKQFRVPCRFSVCVQFAVITICGIYLTRLYGYLENRYFKKKNSRFRFQLRWLLLPLIMIGDYPPMLPIHTYAVLPALVPAELGQGECGTGLYLPYFSGISTEITLYYFGLQLLRGTSCRTINQPINDERNMGMLNFFSMLRYRSVSTDAKQLKQMQTNLVSYARCSHLDWIYFRREIMDSKWREETCKKLGWTMVSPRFCRSNEPVNQFTGDLSCFAPLK